MSSRIVSACCGSGYESLVEGGPRRGRGARRVSYERPMWLVLADAVLLVHLLFVVFAVAGALLVWRWPRLVWAHVPAVLWAAWIELSGGICPLTPIENQLRARGGGEEYSGDFVARDPMPLMYPDGLTDTVQVGLGIAVVLLNVAAYVLMWVRIGQTAR